MRRTKGNQDALIHSDFSSDFNSYAIEHRKQNHKLTKSYKNYLQYDRIEKR